MVTSHGHGHGHGKFVKTSTRDDKRLNGLNKTVTSGQHPAQTFLLALARAERVPVLGRMASPVDVKGR